MTEKRFRETICYMTFILSLLVVMIHSYNVDLFLGPGPYTEPGDRAAAFIEHFLTNVLGPAAVPGFFMVSAYQFYRNVSWDNLADKMRRRVHSVLLPYVVWNFLYYMGYVCLRRVPALTAIVGEGEVAFSLPLLLDAVINFSYNPVFWYLYQLILLIALAPVLYPILKNPRLGAAALILLAIAIACYAGVPWLNLDALFYYGAAAYCAIHGRHLAEAPFPRRRLVMAALAALAAACYLFSITTYYVIFTVLYRLLAPAALWLLLTERPLAAPRSWMQNGFFLYAIHFILVRAINKGAALFLPGTWQSALILFLIIPAIAVLFAWKTGQHLKKHLPLLWRLLSGGRG